MGGGTVTAGQNATQDTGILRLGYGFVPSPTPIRASASGANPNTIDLQVVISNPAGQSVIISRIVVTIPTGGPEAGQISTVPSLPNPRYDQSMPWTLTISGSNVGIVPSSGSPTRLGNPIIFTLPGIQVNEQPGQVFIGINEQTSQGTATISGDPAFTLQKQVATFPVTSFTVTPSVLDDIDEPVVLNWVCSDQGKLLSYSLRAEQVGGSTRDDRAASAERADGAGGSDGASHPAGHDLRDFHFKDCLGSGDCYTCQDGHDGVTVPGVSQPTTFTLDVVQPDDFGHREIIASISTTVRVNVPTFSTSSHTVVSPTGRLVVLHWLAFNAGRCSVMVDRKVIDDNAPVDTYHAGYFVYLSGPPATHQFTVVAHAVTGPAVAEYLSPDITVTNPTPVRLDEKDAQLASPVFTRDGQAVFVADVQANQVRVLDVPSQQPEPNPIPVGRKPSRVVVSPDGARALVVNQGDPFVSILDVAGRRNTGTTIPVANVVDVAIMPDSTTALLCLENGELLEYPDSGTTGVGGPKTSLGNLPPSAESVAAAVTPDGMVAVWIMVNPVDMYGYVFICDLGPGSSRSAGRVGQLPSALALTPDSTLALVASGQSNTVTVIDLASSSVQRTIQVGANPQGIAITPDSRRALVACALDPNLMVIDIETGAVEQLPIGAHLAGIGLARDGSSALAVSSDGSATVFFI
jgi:YVTN family beta-propeller protein